MSFSLWWNPLLFNHWWNSSSQSQGLLEIIECSGVFLNIHNATHTPAFARSTGDFSPIFTTESSWAPSQTWFKLRGSLITISGWEGALVWPGCVAVWVGVPPTPVGGIQRGWEVALLLRQSAGSRAAPAFALWRLSFGLPSLCGDSSLRVFGDSSLRVFGTGVALAWQVAWGPSDSGSCRVGAAANLGSALSLRALKTASGQWWLGFSAWR